MVTIVERFQCSFLKERFGIHRSSAFAPVFLKSILFINNLTEQTISTKFKNMHFIWVSMYLAQKD